MQTEVEKVPLQVKTYVNHPPPIENVQTPEKGFFLNKFQTETDFFSEGFPALER